MIVGFISVLLWSETLVSGLLSWQVACCCGSAACSCCCNCCPKIKQSTGTRVMYALYFLLVTITCVFMMSPTVEQAIKTNVSGTKLNVGPF